MFVKDNDNEHFFYNAGLYIGDLLGARPIAFRRKVVDEFHAFVIGYGGVDNFPSSRDAVKQFLSKKKGVKGARSKRH